MENDRINNSVRNIIFGLLKYVVGIIFPFIIRTILIYKLGMEYTGIISLFSSILQVLSLSELGFSTAVVYALYEPVAKKDNERICQLVSFFKKVYKCCGGVILILGICICPFIKQFIGGEYPQNINIYIIFGLLLLNTTASYLFFGYKSVLFSANQRDDILSKCTIISNFVLYIIQIVSLSVLSNYYIYVVCMIIGTLLNNILLKYFSKKMYPEIVDNGKLGNEEQKKIIKNVTALFGHQLDSVIITSIDNIIISMFLGLSILTIYNNYYYILNSLLSILIMISNSFAGSIGNSIAIESKEKNFKNFIDFTYFIGTISAISTILLFVLFQDFMVIWMGKELLLDTGIVLCLCISFFARQFRRSIVIYKVAAGIWVNDALKPYIASIVNLVLNVIFVKVIGLYGVIISTIISLFLIETPWETIIFFKEYFKNGINKYISVQIKVILKMIIIGVIITIIGNKILGNSIILFIVKAVILGITTLLLYIISSLKDEEYIYIIEKMKYIYKKIKKEKK